MEIENKLGKLNKCLLPPNIDWYTCVWDEVNYQVSFYLIEKEKIYSVQLNSSSHFNFRVIKLQLRSIFKL